MRPLRSRPVTGLVIARPKENKPDQATMRPDRVTVRSETLKTCVSIIGFIARSHRGQKLPRNAIFKRLNGRMDGRTDRLTHLEIQGHT